MKVLLTNDDGVGAEGLETLRDQLSLRHEVWTVAPDMQRSGMSHAITLHESVTLTCTGGTNYSCSGTPADCVLYSLLGAIPFIPDVVVSGINHGPNIGTDIIYSGTVAGARQAALMDYPGIAVSLVSDAMDFGPAAQFVDRTLAQLVGLWNSDMFYNVNVPEQIRAGAPAAISRPARRRYNDELQSEPGEKGSVVHTLHGTLNDAEAEEGTDWAAVEDGLIAVSPVNLHPLNQSGKAAYHSLSSLDVR